MFIAYFIRVQQNQQLDWFKSGKKDQLLYTNPLDDKFRAV